MLISIGDGNYIEKDKVISILKSGSAPMRKLKENKKANNKLVDATFGKPTKSFILMENDTLILSAVSTTNLSDRINKLEGNEIQ